MKKIGFSLWFIVYGLLLPTYAQQETIEILTYYPAPYGVYRQLASVGIGGVPPLTTPVWWPVEGSTGAESTLVLMNIGVPTNDVTAGNITVPALLQVGGICEMPSGSPPPPTIHRAAIFGIEDAGIAGFGTADASVGVYGFASGNFLVTGEEPNTHTDYPIGVMGESTNGIGVQGQGAVRGVSGHVDDNPFAYGVEGRANSVYSFGVVGVNNTQYDFPTELPVGQYIGIYGSGLTIGVLGLGGNSGLWGKGNFYGVSGISSNVGVSGWTTGWTYPTGVIPGGIGVFGGSNSYAIYGYCAESTGYAGYFNGNVHVTGQIEMDADSCPGGKLIYPAEGAIGPSLTPGDLAELIQCNADVELSDVVSIDTSNNEFIISTIQNDTAVAGIVSEDPILAIGSKKIHEKNNPENNYQYLALAGQVYCKVDASYGEIQPGDLLTTSPTPGHAMKAKPIGEINGYPIYPQGCIIGKALEPLKEGKGKILVLVCLM